MPWAYICPLLSSADTALLSVHIGVHRQVWLLHREKDLSPRSLARLDGWVGYGGAFIPAFERQRWADI